SYQEGLALPLKLGDYNRITVLLHTSVRWHSDVEITSRRKDATKKAYPSPARWGTVPRSVSCSQTWGRWPYNVGSTCRQKCICTRASLWPVSSDIAGSSVAS